MCLFRTLYTFLNTKLRWWLSQFYCNDVAFMLFSTDNKPWFSELELVFELDCCLQGVTSFQCATVKRIANLVVTTNQNRRYVTQQCEKISLHQTRACDSYSYVIIFKTRTHTACTSISDTRSTVVIFVSSCRWNVLA